ncbi:MAG: HD domain-containing protein [Patescibacteria group bacterium]
MNKKQIISQTAEYVKAKMTGESSGHDWWHVYRVWKSAVNIGRKEKVDLFVVELAALLHDIADWKFVEGDNNSGQQPIGDWLKKMAVDGAIVSHVCQIIKDISFKGADVVVKVKTPEGLVVQDADRLDAIGAIGIARTFTTGAARGRVLFNPDVPPEKEVLDFRAGKDSYSSIHHFYDKILRLKDLMNTATAKKIAKKRHEVIEKFLAEFFKEWEGKA